MKSLLIAAVALSLTACAPSYQRLRAKAAQDTNDTLCMVQIVKPEYAEVARHELASRGAVCDWEMTKLQAQAYLQQRQASSAESASQLNAAAILLQNSGPRPLAPPMPFPTTTNCRSVNQGFGVIQTTCN